MPRGDGHISFAEQKAVVAEVAMYRLNARGALRLTNRELDAWGLLKPKFVAPLLAKALVAHADAGVAPALVGRHVDQLYGRLHLRWYKTATAAAVPAGIAYDLRNLMLQTAPYAIPLTHDDAVDQPRVAVFGATLRALRGYYEPPADGARRAHGVDAVWQLLANSSSHYKSEKNAAHLLTWYEALSRYALLVSAETGQWSGYHAACKKHTGVRAAAVAQLEEALADGWLDAPLAQRARPELGVAAPEAPLARKRKRPQPRAAPNDDDDERTYDLSLDDILPEGFDPLDWQLEPEPEPEPTSQLRVTAFFTVRKVQRISPAINVSPLKGRRRTVTAVQVEPSSEPSSEPPVLTVVGPVALECQEQLDWDLVASRGPRFVQVV